MPNDTPKCYEECDACSGAVCMTHAGPCDCDTAQRHIGPGGTIYRGGRFGMVIVSTPAPTGDAAHEAEEWGDAVAAIAGCPGPPPAEAIERLIAVGDAALRRLALVEAEAERLRQRVKTLEAELQTSEAAPKLLTRFTVLPPYLAEDGRKPIEVHKPCLETRVYSCREIYPGEPEMHCSYCSGLAQATPTGDPAPPPQEPSNG